MNYAEAIAVRKRQINNQPVSREELAQANRTIAHQRAMAGAFGRPEYEPAPSPSTEAQPQPQARTSLPRGCISVDEWLRTLRPSESYKTVRK